MASPDFVTEQMCLALQKMQQHKTWDFSRMVDDVYCGCWILDPRKSPGSANLIYGVNLAIQTRVNAQHNITELR